LIDEAPQIVIPAITTFVDEPDAAASGLRLTARDIEALPTIEAGTGTSGVSGIQTRVLMGNPNKSGPYTIQLDVPANTRIEAHTHPDSRVVTVISGSWYFGYGTRFEERELKELTAGSFYTEPANTPHFARTGNTPVIVQISGSGPSGTRYVVQTPTK
jgi:quercetin dioxygenase-like cupin family protein